MVKSKKARPFRHSKHIAGIIPLGEITTDYTLPWNNGLLPLNGGYTALHRAIEECSMVGCKSIWVIAELGVQPILKKTVGEQVPSIQAYSESIIYKNRYRKKNIPVFFVPLPLRKDKMINIFPWHILYGADLAYRMTWRLTPYAAADKYYVAFPQGVYDYNQFLYERSEFTDKYKNIVLTYQGKSIKNGYPMGFSFMEDDYFRYRDYLTATVIKDLRHDTTKEMLRETFQTIDIKNSNKFELEDYQDISSWEGYKSSLNMNLYSIIDKHSPLHEKKRIKRSLSNDKKK